MIKFTSITTLLILLVIQLNSQTIDFTRYTVDNDFNGPAGITLGDIDNDGFEDIICAGLDGNEVAWWQNTGETPISWEKHLIDGNIDSPIYVSCADINGDGFNDIAVALWDGNKVLWYENDGSSQPQFTKHIIKEGFDRTHEVLITDIDLDEDMDIIGVSADLNSISWFENDGNSPIGWTEHAIVTDFAGARSVDAMDVDGDNDIDLCGAALIDNEISWWRNDGGNPIQWTKFIISADFGQSHKVQFIDMDLDGNIDILGTGYSSGIKWWRNNGEDSIVWEPNNVSGNATTVIAYGVDLDMDGDNDIIASAQGSGYVAFFENSGNNSLDFDFNYLDNFPGAWPLYYGDMDNDGDSDMVCGGNSSNEIRWYQNDIITNIETVSVQQEDIQISPIPASNRISYRISPGQTYPVKISIFDISGSLIKTDISTNPDTDIDISELKNGVYTISGKFKNTVIHKKFVKF